MRNDPKPRGQALNGVGASVNFVASVLNRRSDRRLAEGDAEAAGGLKIAAIVFGALANAASMVGNADTAHGEAWPVTAPPADEERGEAPGEQPGAIAVQDRALAAT